MAARTANNAISVANEEIIKKGLYTTVDDTIVDLADAVASSVKRVESYDPVATARLHAEQTAIPGTLDTKITLTAETSTQAGARLHAAGAPAVTILNFASARNPGGGYLGGATAQEEDICRSSALYTTLLAAPDYHSAHRAHKDWRYSHRVIWSPDVPVYRGEGNRLLDAFYTVNFVTSPAPNAGVPKTAVEPGYIKAILKERAGRVLAVCRAHHARSLVLGAWGCGVFHNDPNDVASMFSELLEGEFKGVFDEVVFAIYDRSKSHAVMGAFERVFGPVTAPTAPTSTA